MRCGCVQCIYVPIRAGLYLMVGKWSFLSFESVFGMHIHMALLKTKIY